MHKKDIAFIMGMGGPDSIEAIEPFLYNLFSDRDIINFHIGDTLQRFIAKKIAKKRSKKIAPSYLKMGHNGASPQNIYHKRIFEKVEKKYKEITGRSLTILEANCYYHPFVEDTIKELKKEKYDRYIFTTVYPQYSMTTVEACFNRLSKIYSVTGACSTNNTIIPYWYENMEYNKCIASRIEKTAVKLGKNINECHILYSAHSVPLSYIEKGDIYPAHIKKQVDIINNLANIKSYEISYQSKVGPVKWLSPSTQSTIERYVAERKDNIIVVPISFISDHIETLIELDEELIPIAKNKGMNIERCESLNDSEDFISAFTNILIG